MTTEHESSVAVVRRQLELLEAGDVEGILDILDDDVLFELPYVNIRLEGKSQVEASVRMMTSSMEGYSFSDVVLEPMLNPRRVLARMHMRVHVVATGRDYENDYVSLYEVADGKITSIQDHFDTRRYLEAFAPQDSPT